MGMGWIKEFRAFAMRGNVIDFAVGIIIGAAFTSIVDSLVKDIFTPPIGWLVGGLDFSNLFISLKGSYASLDAAQKAGAPTINYGLFINACIKFMLVAFALFILIKQVNRLKAIFEKEQADAPPPPPPRSEQLLAEIRDLLKAGR